MNCAGFTLKTVISPLKGWNINMALAGVEAFLS